jgi:hypothetical protein
MDAGELALAAREQAAREREERNQALVVLAQGGDVTAVAVLLKDNHGLVVMCKRRLRYQWAGANPDELEVAGVEGLWEAVKSFRPDLGIKFSTWATHCIKRAMKPQRCMLEQWKQERADEGVPLPPLAQLAIARDEPDYDELPAEAMPLPEVLPGLMLYLHPRTRAAVRVHFGFPASSAEVLAVRGLSKARVQVVVARAARAMAILHGDPDADVSELLAGAA